MRCRRFVRVIFCVILVVGLGAIQVARAQHSMGARFDDAAYEEEPLTAPLTRCSYRGMPASASLRRFTPTPGDQGQQGSCVGWATAYATRTLTEAQLEEIDRRYRIDDTRFSPAYVYNQIKIGGCDGGSLIRDAMQVLERKGVAQLDEYPYDDGTCYRSVTSTDRRNAAPFKIDDYKRLFTGDSRGKHVAMKLKPGGRNPRHFRDVDAGQLS